MFKFKFKKINLFLEVPPPREKRESAPPEGYNGSDRREKGSYKRQAGVGMV